MNYEIIKKIGEGNFGEVFLIKIENKNYVLKRIKYRLSQEEIKKYDDIIKAISKINNKYIIKYYSTFQEKDSYNIIMEYAGDCNLKDFIDTQKTKHNLIEEKIIKEIIIQIILGLKEIHRNKIIHRDLTPDNIFIDKNNNIKIGDFGISKILINNDRYAKSIVGKYHYFAPEIDKGEQYNNKIDIYALGCIIYELFTLNKYYLDKRIDNKVCEIDTDIYNGIWQDLIDSLLKNDYHERPDIETIINFKNLFEVPLINKYEKYNIINMKNIIENTFNNISDTKILDLAVITTEKCHLFTREKNNNYNISSLSLKDINYFNIFNHEIIKYYEYLFREKNHELNELNEEQNKILTNKDIFDFDKFIKEFPALYEMKDYIYNSDFPYLILISEESCGKNICSKLLNYCDNYLFYNDDDKIEMPLSDIFEKLCEKSNICLKKYGQIAFKYILSSSEKSKVIHSIILFNIDQMKKHKIFPFIINKIERHNLNYNYNIEEKDENISKKIKDYLELIANFNRNPKLKINLQNFLIVYEIYDIECLIFLIKHRSEINYLELIEKEGLEYEVNLIKEIFEKIVPTFCQDIIISIVDSGVKPDNYNNMILEIYNKSIRHNLASFLEKIKQKRNIIYTFSRITDDIFQENIDIKNEFGTFNTQSSLIEFVEKINLKKI